MGSILIERRQRRRQRVRGRALESTRHRLLIHRSLKHFYAQITTPDGSAVVVEASTLSKDLREKLTTTGNCQAAEQVGELVAQRALEAKIKKVWFDRGPFRYHGRVRAMAEAARKAGLDF